MDPKKKQHIVIHPRDLYDMQNRRVYNQNNVRIEDRPLQTRSAIDPGNSKVSSQLRHRLTTKKIASTKIAKPTNNTIVANGDLPKKTIIVNSLSILPPPNSNYPAVTYRNSDGCLTSQQIKYITSKKRFSSSSDEQNAEDNLVGDPLLSESSLNQPQQSEIAMKVLRNGINSSGKNQTRAWGKGLQEIVHLLDDQSPSGRERKSSDNDLSDIINGYRISPSLALPKGENKEKSGQNSKVLENGHVNKNLTGLYKIQFKTSSDELCPRSVSLKKNQPEFNAQKCDSADGAHKSESPPLLEREIIAKPDLKNENNREISPPLLESNIAVTQENDIQNENNCTEIDPPLLENNNSSPIQSEIVIEQPKLQNENNHSERCTPILEEIIDVQNDNNESDADRPPLLEKEISTKNPDVSNEEKFIKKKKSTCTLRKARSKSTTKRLFQVQNISRKSKHLNKTTQTPKGFLNKTLKKANFSEQISKALRTINMKIDDLYKKIQENSSMYQRAHNLLMEKLQTVYDLFNVIKMLDLTYLLNEENTLIEEDKENVPGYPLMYVGEEKEMDESKQNDQEVKHLNQETEDSLDVGENVTVIVINEENGEIGDTNSHEEIRIEEIKSQNSSNLHVDEMNLVKDTEENLPTNIEETKTVEERLEIATEDIAIIVNEDILSEQSIQEKNEDVSNEETKKNLKEAEDGTIQMNKMENDVLKVEKNKETSIENGDKGTKEEQIIQKEDLETLMQLGPLILEQLLASGSEELMENDLANVLENTDIALIEDIDKNLNEPDQVEEKDFQNLELEDNPGKNDETKLKTAMEKVCKDVKKEVKIEIVKTDLDYKERETEKTRKSETKVQDEKENEPSKRSKGRKRRKNDDVFGRRIKKGRMMDTDEGMVICTRSLRSKTVEFFMNP